MPESPRPEAERLLIISRRVADGADEPSYLFVRWPDWPHPALLSLAPPGPSDTLDDAVAALLDARLSVSPAGAVRVGATRVPVRMPQPRFGLVSTGWLRAVAVEVAGTPETDALLEGFEELTVAGALTALTTEVERAIFREGAALFNSGAY